MDKFDEYASSLVPQATRSQILLEIADDTETLEKALSVLHCNGFPPIAYEFVKKGSPTWIHIYLPPVDIKKASLTLTEAGFSRLSSLSAKPLQSKLQVVSKEKANGT